MKLKSCVMLNNITWQGYWTTIALLSLSYYLIIYLLYYRDDFKIILQERFQLHKEKGTAIPDPSIEENSSIEDLIFGDEISSEFSEPDKQSDESIVYGCMDEFKAYFEEAKKSRCVKEELVYAIQRILLKYPALKTSKYKESITKVLLSQAKHICSVQLSVDDVVHVWSGG